MVPPPDNETINTRSRSDFKSYSPGEQLVMVMASLAQSHEELTHLIKKDQIDIDVYSNENNSGTITLNSEVRTPWVVTDVIATWQAVPAQPSQSATGKVTSPTASQVLATLGSNANAQYTVTAIVNLSGTLSATDTNNIQLNANGSGYAVLPIEPVTTEQTFGPFIINSNGSAISLTAIGAGTVGAIYDVELIIQQTGDPEVVTIQIGKRTFYPLPSAGSFILTSVNGMRLDLNEICKMTVSPIIPISFEVMGYADTRKFDRT